MCLARWKRVIGILGKGYQPSYCWLVKKTPFCPIPWALASKGVSWAGTFLWDVPQTISRAAERRLCTRYELCFLLLLAVCL